MDVLKPLITTDEFISLLKKSRLSDTDVFKLASVTPYTLVEQLKDLKREELSEVYILEVKNIYRVLNTIGILLGVFPSASRLVQQVVSMDFVQRLLQECEELNDNTMSVQTWKFLMLSRFLLSNCDPQAKLEPKFEGKIPTKLFSFRQMTAEEWFKDYANTTLSRTALILDKANADEACRYLFLNIAWYINKSQTFKYHRKSIDKNDNDMFYRILSEFIDSVGGDNTIIKNTPTNILYKDL